MYRKNHVRGTHREQRRQAALRARKARLAAGARNSCTCCADSGSPHHSVTPRGDGHRGAILEQLPDVDGPAAVLLTGRTVYVDATSQPEPARQHPAQ